MPWPFSPSALQPHVTSSSSQRSLQGHSYTYEQPYILTRPSFRQFLSSAPQPSQPSSVARLLITADPQSRATTVCRSAWCRS
ncbi:hypothetical protein E2C01_072602 [Portunus trituberculatus]|uniref:Uncharacterized protein n=1 Tax=Portunus trituberculatus TaxID=210409 RepID=A0A5B7I752_PORTR|nr:hypothetical protein [Portunus trituberculatus]